MAFPDSLGIVQLVSGCLIFGLLGFMDCHLIYQNIFTFPNIPFVIELSAV